jgi:hypothetical protein
LICRLQLKTEASFWFAATFGFPGSKRLSDEIRQNKKACAVVKGIQIVAEGSGVCERSNRAAALWFCLICRAKAGAAEKAFLLP